MMASNMMVKNVKKQHKILDGIKKGYVKVLEFSLRRKSVVIITSIVLLVLSIAGALRIGTEFFPASDSGQISINLTMPKGTAFEDTVTAADRLVEIISDIEDVETIGATMSGGMFGMGMGQGRGNGDAVSINVLLKDSKTKSTSEIAQLIRNKTQNFEGEITVSDSGMDMTAMSGGAIAINIKGREFDVLEKVAKDVAKIVSEVEGTVEITDGLDKASPELRIAVDKEKSIANGLTVAQVYMEINKYLQQEDAVTTISLGANILDVIVKDESSLAQLDRKDIMELTLTSAQGKTVAIKDIASMEEATGFSTINRSNQQRYVTVGAQIADGHNIGIISDEISKRLSTYETPEGYFIDMGGEDKMIRDSFKDLFLMLVLAVAFIYLIMVAQFQSLLSPFIVMFTIPLAFTGGFFGLMVAGKPVSIVAFVGLIILSGVVVNNGIVFVDYINILRQSGKNKKEAIIEAGTTRLRPIIMTALTTIIALSTMSVGVGMGTELIQPMAITAIGGLIYATLLTLVLIPVLYDVFNRKEKAVPRENI